MIDDIIKFHKYQSLNFMYAAWIRIPVQCQFFFKSLDQHLADLIEKCANDNLKEGRGTSKWARRSWWRYSKKESACETPSHVNILCRKILKYQNIKWWIRTSYCFLLKDGWASEVLHLKLRIRSCIQRSGLA